MKQKGLYKAALYCRLSQDDGLVGDSSSIQTQKMMLEKYANDNGIIIVDYYIDDGYSGTNFDRPAFPRMIADIDDEKVNMVITKDLSRLGRDYVRTGYYIDFYFKDKDIRYIAINDNVDTLYENNDIAPFKNILNEMYAKDTSRKVKIAKRLLMQKGLYMAAQPPYGYKKDPNDKNHLVIDEEAAKVVKLIFDLVLSNMGISTIAKELNKRCVPIPSVYKASKGYQCYQTLLDSRKLKYNDDDVEKWSTATVGNILRNQMYVGDMVGNKREIKNYRTGKQIIHTKDEYIVIPNTHEPIISREDFEKVQKQVSNKHRPSKTNHENIFRGILKCANCGRSMTMYHKVLANGKVVWRYRCMGKTIRHGIDTESNIIKYDDIYNVVFKRLKELFNSIKKDDDSFINDLISKNTNLDKEKKLDADKVKIERKLDTINKLIKKLYEDYIEGILTADNYQKLVDEYQKEQVELKERLEEIKKYINKKQMKWIIL
jgi:site-specific recombinase